MKRILSVLLIATMVIGLVACSGKEQTVTMTTTMNGADVEMVLDAKGDKINRITQKTELSIEGVSEDQLEQYKTTLDGIKASYDAIDGVTYKVNYSDTKIEETIVMDVGNSDTLKKLIDSKLLPVTKSNAKALSLKKTKEGLESSGWTEKK